MADHVEAVLSKFQLIAITQIKPSPYQARKEFDEEALKKLAESIKHEGLIEPIVVRQVGEDYEVISGERRLRACKLLGLTTIEAKIIEPVNEASTAAKGLVENLQRENLNPVEEAEGFDALNKLDPNYWTQEQIGQIAGKDRTYITRSISLLSLPQSILDDVRRRTLTRDHAIELMRINNAKDQKRMAFKVGKKGLTAKQTREMVDRKLGKTSSEVRAKGSELPSRQVNSGRDPDLLSDIWSVLNPTVGLLRAEYRGGMVWRLDISPRDADLTLPNRSALKKELMIKLADALILTGQTLKVMAAGFDEDQEPKP